MVRFILLLLATLGIFSPAHAATDIGGIVQNPLQPASTDLSAAQWILQSTTGDQSA
jgi:hypothetical protein